VPALDAPEPADDFGRFGFRAPGCLGHVTELDRDDGGEDAVGLHAGLDARDKLLDGAENGILIADEGQVVFTRQLDEAGARDALGDVAALADLEAAVAGAMDHQSRHAHQREDGANIDLGVHMRERDGGAGAVRAFNPVHGQGMSTAAIGAELLETCLRDRRMRTFQKRLARALEFPWTLATSEDIRYPGVEGGAAGLRTRLTHWYLDRVIALSVRNIQVRSDLLAISNLVQNPATLFRPGTVARVLWDGLWPDCNSRTGSLESVRTRRLRRSLRPGTRTGPGSIAAGR
jgi:hypothetical protein